MDVYRQQSGKVQSFRMRHEMRAGLEEDFDDAGARRFFRFLRRFRVSLPHHVFSGIEIGIFPGFFHDLHLLGDVIRGASSSGCPFLAGEKSLLAANRSRQEGSPG
jgi:hypothetical protein